MKNTYKVNEETVKKIDERVYDNGSIVINKNDLEEMFPELKESEDERIRKTLIEYFKVYPKDYYCELKTSHIIAWLEKQGEQKPTIEMKTPEESLGIDSDTYNKIVDECIYGEQKPAGNVEPKFKVGDKIYLKPEHRMPDDDTPIADTIHEIIAIDDKHYRFEGSFIFIEDQDKFELVEQKPVETEKGAKENEREIPFSEQEWSEDDEQYVKDTLTLLSFGCSIHTITQVQDWLKSLKNRVQPKQEWSEEDSRILYNVKVYIGYAAGQSGVKDELFKEANEWLNSLPIGFIYSKNYNEDMVTLLVSELKQIANDNNVPEQYQMEINWLKSLRPQKQWKPSDEQMDNK